VTHDQEEALAVSDKIVVMNGAGSRRWERRMIFTCGRGCFVADFTRHLIPGSITARREKNHHD
jgi:ABC-type Fe3+/spermidine/putrescine transport system ATPase subunit